MGGCGGCGLVIYCSDYKCSHGTTVRADGWPDRRPAVRSRAAFHMPSLWPERSRCPELGRNGPKHFRDLASEFGRRLRIELQKVVELFGVKNATISIDDVHMPSGRRQSPSSRHGDYRVYIERSL